MTLAQTTGISLYPTGMWECGNVAGKNIWIMGSLSCQGKVLEHGSGLGEQLGMESPLGFIPGFPKKQLGAEPEKSGLELPVHPRTLLQ